MRNRSQSPIQSYPASMHAQSAQKKYYSREQVSQVLRTMMQSKLSAIYQQLQQKQQMIRALNQKLNRNDSFLQNATKQMYQINNNNLHNSERNLSNLGEIVNQAVNQRLQGYWHSLQIQLEKIRTQCQDGIRKFHQVLQQKTSKVLTDIKKSCEDNVQTFKKKNNAYWIKVKQALNKMNTKTVQCDQRMANIGVQINKYETQREQNAKINREIQNGTNTAKMLVQLKKSVNNVYKNFQQVLKLQQVVKQKYQRMEPLDKQYCAKCSCSNPQIRTSSSNNQWNYNRNKIAANKQEDIVILQYSVEEDSISNHQIGSQKPDAVLRQHSKSQSVRNSSPAAKFMRNQQFGQGFPLSPITGKIIENSNYSNNQMMLGSERYKIGHQTANTNATMKNETLEWGEHDQYFSNNAGFNDIPRNDRSESFQITAHNSSNQGLMINSNNGSRMVIGNSNAVSTSMLNFSLQCRKQMQESARPRLIQMIQTKGLAKPIKVFLDQINYLKNEQGNYLFDLKGNMFKLNPTQFAQLEQDKIVCNIKGQDSRKTRR